MQQSHVTGTLRGVLDVAVRDHIIERNPCSGVKLPKKAMRKAKRRYLTPEQVQAVSGHLSGQNRTAFLVLCFVGLRWGEMASLRVSDVDLDQRMLTVETSVSYLPTPDGDGGWEWVEGPTKTNQSREAAFPAELTPLLREQVKGKKPDALLFPSQRGGHWRQPAKQTKGHRMEWLERALLAANVPYLSPNELRHTAASLLIASGADVMVAAAQLGHSATMLLGVYADLFPSRLNETVDRMSQFFPA